MGLWILLKTVRISDSGIWDKFFLWAIEISAIGLANKESCRDYLISDSKRELSGIAYNNFQLRIRPIYEDTPTHSAHIYEVVLHYELQLHIKGTATATATPARFIYTTRYVYTWEVIHPCEVGLPLPSWSSSQIRLKTVEKYGVSTISSDVSLI
jgi:hypothetical protein